MGLPCEGPDLSPARDIWVVSCPVFSQTVLHGNFRGQEACCLVLPCAFLSSVLDLVLIEPGIAAGLGVLGWRIGALSLLEEAALRAAILEPYGKAPAGVGDAGMTPPPPLCCEQS